MTLTFAFSAAIFTALGHQIADALPADVSERLRVIVGKQLIDERMPRPTISASTAALAHGSTASKPRGAVATCIPWCCAEAPTGHPGYDGMRHWAADGVGAVALKSNAQAKPRQTRPSRGGENAGETRSRYHRAICHRATVGHLLIVTALSSARLAAPSSSDCLAPRLVTIMKLPEQSASRFCRQRSATSSAGAGVQDRPEIETTDYR